MGIRGATEGIRLERWVAGKSYLCILSLKMWTYLGGIWNHNQGLLNLGVHGS